MKTPDQLAHSREIMHGMRNALAVLKANLEFLRDELSASERSEAIRESSEEIDRIAKFMDELTQVNP